MGLPRQSEKDFVAEGKNHSPKIQDCGKAGIRRTQTTGSSNYPVTVAEH